MLRHGLQPKKHLWFSHTEEVVAKMTTIRSNGAWMIGCVSEDKYPLLQQWPTITTEPPLTSKYLMLRGWWSRDGEHKRLEMNEFIYYIIHFNSSPFHNKHRINYHVPISRQRPGQARPCAPSVHVSGFIYAQTPDYVLYLIPFFSTQPCNE